MNAFEANRSHQDGIFYIVTGKKIYFDVSWAGTYFWGHLHDPSNFGDLFSVLQDKR